MTGILLRRLRVSFACAAFGSALCGPGIAAGAISSPTVLAGPSSAIVGVGNAAMAADGTGGMIWLQVVDGAPHVFVSRYGGGHWSSPVRADATSTEPASFPAVAAAPNGDLLALWVQPFESVSSGGATPTTVDQLMSAVLAPGSRHFGAPVAVDPANVASGTGVDPQVAMAPDGVAYVVYRVVTNPLAADQSQPPGTPSPMRPGDELVDVRVARFNGRSWSSLGVMNAAPGQVTLRAPTAANEPQIGIDPGGQGMVVWQEPTVDGVARIWGRRLFGLVPGYAQQISPSTLANQPVSVDADAPALSFGTNAQAEVMFRLAGGVGNPLGQSAEMFASIGTANDIVNGGAFSPAVSVAGATSVGAASLATSLDNAFVGAYTANGTAQLISGQSGNVAANGTSTLGPASGDPVVAIDRGSDPVVAWPDAASGAPRVDLQESFPGGAEQTANLTAPHDGPISGLSIDGSGAGDAIVGFEQGASSDTQVVADSVEASPQPFGPLSATVVDDVTWIRPSQGLILWQPSLSAVGPVSYAVTLDGHSLASGLQSCGYPVSLNLQAVDGTSACGFRIPAGDLTSGMYQVQITATDRLGQQTRGMEFELHVDGSAPVVSTQSLPGRRVRVHIREPYSGLALGITRISFGDGSRPLRYSAVATHRYAKAGIYRIVVNTASAVGRTVTDHLLVRVR